MNQSLTTNFGKEIQTAQTSIAHNEIALHCAIERPISVQSTSAHSPVPLSTLAMTSFSGSTSIMNSNEAPQEGTSSSGRCCSHICLPARATPIRLEIEAKKLCVYLAQFDVGLKQSADRKTSAHPM